MKVARYVREGVHVSTSNGRPVPTSLFSIGGGGVFN